MSNALAPTGAGGELVVPDHIKALLRPEGYAQDVGEITRQDIGLNFFNIVHGMSAQAKPNWDNAGAAPLPPGTMLLTRDRKIVPPNTIVIPLLRKVKYGKFKVDPATGRDTKEVLGMADRRDDPRIVAENGLAWREINGKKIPPAWRTIVNFWCVTPLNMTEAAVMGFSKTALKVAQKWTSELARLTGGWKLPLYALRFRVKDPTWTPERTLPDGSKSSWPQFNVVFDGYVKETALPTLKLAYENAVALYQATSEITENFVQMQEASGGPGELAGDMDEPALKSAMPAAPAAQKQIAAPTPSVSTVQTPAAAKTIQSITTPAGMAAVIETEIQDREAQAAPATAPVSQAEETAEKLW